MLLFLKDKKESSNLSVDIIWLTVIFKITVLQGSLREASPKRRRLVVIFFPKYNRIRKYRFDVIQEGF